MEIHPCNMRSCGSQIAATSDPRGHGKEPAAHLQTAINHRSYLSIPLLCFRGWLGRVVVCKRLLMLHSQAKHWAGGLGTIGNKLFPRGGSVCAMQSPQYGGTGQGRCSEESLPVLPLLLFRLWAPPSCCEGPAFSFTIRISLGHTLGTSPGMSLG